MSSAPKAPHAKPMSLAMPMSTITDMSAKLKPTKRRSTNSRGVSQTEPADEAIDALSELRWLVGHRTPKK
jgi:hypothetical protein